MNSFIKFVNEIYIIVVICFAQARKDKKIDPLELSALEKVNSALLLGTPARSAGLTLKEAEALKSLMLLTMKPVIFAANVGDADLAKGNEMSKQLFDYAAKHNSVAVLVSAQVCNIVKMQTISFNSLHMLLYVFILLQGGSGIGTSRRSR